jgi:ribosomal protein L37AE/L43A
MPCPKCGREQVCIEAGTAIHWTCPMCSVPPASLTPGTMQCQKCKTIHTPHVPCPGPPAPACGQETESKPPCPRCKELEAEIARLNAQLLGSWRCSCCGELLESAADPAWRWNGTAWEHKCPGSDPQCGHQIARSFAAEGRNP